VSARTGNLGEGMLGSDSSPISLECPTTISARGMSPSNAVVETLGPDSCRLRSVVMFDPQAFLEFEVRLAGRPPTTVRGRVTDRIRVGPRFIYTLAIESTAISIDSITPETRLRPISSFKDIPETHGLMRAKPRSQAEFSLQYRTAREGFKHAKAENVSTGGLLITCGDALTENAVLELQFTLPSDVLSGYPAYTTVFDLRNPFKRKTVPSKLRRPFEEVVVSARITRCQSIAPGVYQYGLAFLSMDPGTRQELARYVDAVRHRHRHKLRCS